MAERVSRAAPWQRELVLPCRTPPPSSWHCITDSWSVVRHATTSSMTGVRAPAVPAVIARWPMVAVSSPVTLPCRPSSCRASLVSMMAVILAAAMELAALTRAIVGLSARIVGTAPEPDSAANVPGCVAFFFVKGRENPVAQPGLAHVRRVRGHRDDPLWPAAGGACKPCRLVTFLHTPDDSRRCSTCRVGHLQILRRAHDDRRPGVDPISATR
jgi:hypothetical protein